MTLSSVFQRYKLLAAGKLREMATERARGDSQKLQKLDKTTDDALLRRWLWTYSILGIVVVYALVPAILSFLGRFIPIILLSPLWLAVDLAKGVVVIMICLAIYFTVSRSAR